MAKIDPKTGLMTGLLGDKVFSVRNGKQLVKSRPIRRAEVTSHRQLETNMRMKKALAYVKTQLETNREQWEIQYKEDRHRIGKKQYDCLFRWMVAKALFDL